MMQTFLQAVAASLLKRFGTNLSGLTVVFPGKRASLFLDQALAQLAGGPVWSPRYRTISELFEEASPYSVCDPVESVCRLHRVYSRFVNDAQPLDQFYGWGEILLADFDDVDKHCADAHKLFANICDLRALENLSYIEPQQEKALRQFFSNFSVAETTRIKESFLRLWTKMADIYDGLNADMMAAGTLYEGALQRKVVEEGFPQTDTTYVMVGFNVLNDVEMQLFDQLRERGQALFFWDYDRFYTTPHSGRSHEAGHFIVRNLERYGNELDASYFDNMRQPKDIAFVTSSTETAQTRYIPRWLANSQCSMFNVQSSTAVVLCNELLLQPVLQALPSGYAVNVSMGFPMADTPVFGFINQLLALQTEGYDNRRQAFRYTYLRNMRCHPYSRIVDETIWSEHVSGGAGLLFYLLEALRQLGINLQQRMKTGNPQPFDILHAEAVFKCYTTLSRLLDLVQADEPLLCVSDLTLCRIIRSALQQQTIPFHGEPATGLQVLGVLETRALDFTNLLMLSVGEGYLPKTTGDTSFIPYNLKEAFGLTTLSHKIAVYAYYFYRLIQRAEHITFVYDDSNAGMRQNEMSRFLRQLLAETTFPIKHSSLVSPQSTACQSETVVQKTDQMMAPLRGFTSLSPSAINTYTSCPMQFYYKYVQGLRVDPDPEDGLDPILFGNVFHKAAELAYQRLTASSRMVQAEDIRQLLRDSSAPVDAIVDEAFRKEFFNHCKAEYTGILILARRVIRQYLVNLLRYDIQSCPITIIDVETKTNVSIWAGNTQFEVGGIIDRLDKVQVQTDKGPQTVVRIVDYKTGAKPQSMAVPHLDNLFRETGQKEHYYFQTILYGISIARSEQCAVAPCLFYLPSLSASDFIPTLKLEGQEIADVRTIEREFMARVEALVTEIFDPNQPFTQTTRREACRFCNYRTLCGK